MIVFLMVYLLIGVLFSIGVATYVYFNRRDYHFDRRRAWLVFLLIIPFGWPYVIFRIGLDLLQRRFKIFL